MGRIVFIVLTALIIPAPCLALTIPYSASGSVYLTDLDSEENYTESLSGDFYIDENPDLYYKIGDPSRISSARYAIDSFSMYFGSYNFYGSGEIFMSDSDFTITLNGSGDLDYMWLNDEINCSTFDFLLPDHMYAGHYVGFYPEPNIHGGAVLLNLDLPAVPEPSTIVLLGIGFVGLAGSARRKEIKKIWKNLK